MQERIRGRKQKNKKNLEPHLEDNFEESARIRTKWATVLARGQTRRDRDPAVTVTIILLQVLEKAINKEEKKYEREEIEGLDKITYIHLIQI